jgi:hypothetical protein
VIPGLTTLPILAIKDFRYCDICFQYDLDGPKNLGRFRKGFVYFAVANLPSDTYALGNGEYIVRFLLAAENCERTDCTFKLFINLGIDDPSKRVRFEQLPSD